MKTTDNAISAWKLHAEACDAGLATYDDPKTGYQVFTRVGLLERGKCCGAGCRHCPYAHEAVNFDRRIGSIQQAAWLTVKHRSRDKTPALLFWSGGKDSFLAYRTLGGIDANIVLITTYDAVTGVIAHQGIQINDVVEQANKLGVGLIGVPLHPGRSYLEHLLPVLDLVPGCTSLCFGDLHLAHIREWREQAFAANPKTSHLPLLFPLWDTPYEQLIDSLESAGVQCTVSAVADSTSGVSVGDTFDRDLIARLPDHVDAFGENGEFHTRVVIA